MFPELPLGVGVGVGGDFIFPTMYKHREFLPPRLHSQASYLADDTFSRPGKAELRQSPVAGLAVSVSRGMDGCSSSLTSRTQQQRPRPVSSPVLAPGSREGASAHFSMGGNYIYYKSLCFLPVCFTKMVQT